MSNASDQGETGRVRQPPLPRTAKQVIDQAIKENRTNEYLLYGFSIVFVVVGTITLLWGMYHDQGLVAIAGGIANALFYPAMKLAREIRRENIAIRLVENPLSMAHSSKEASDALKEFFVETFIKRPSNPE